MSGEKNIWSHDMINAWYVLGIVQKLWRSITIEHELLILERKIWNLRCVQLNNILIRRSHIESFRRKLIFSSRYTQICPCSSKPGCPNYLFFPTCNNEQAGNRICEPLCYRTMIFQLVLSLNTFWPTVRVLSTSWSVVKVKVKQIKQK